MTVIEHWTLRGAPSRASDPGRPMCVAGPLVSPGEEVIVMRADQLTGAVSALTEARAALHDLCRERGYALRDAELARERADRTHEQLQGAVTAADEATALAERYGNAIIAISAALPNENRVRAIIASLDTKELP